MDKYLVLICDNETSEWSIAVDTTDKVEAMKEYGKLKEKRTGAIVIFTGDYVTV